MIYRVYFRDPLHPEAPLDHYDFLNITEAAEACQRMVGVVSVEMIDGDEPTREISAA
jgi:hypothetical protein